MCREVSVLVMKVLVKSCVEQRLVQILVLVVSIQMGPQKTEVGKGFM